ncbi:MAG: putative dsRNA-binding protein [Trueperaceae bacterium]
MAHPKGVLIERVQKLGLPRPEFHTERTGPEHEPQFASDAVVDGEVLGSGHGGSKRTAERHAAEAALAELDRRAEGKKPSPKKARSGGSSRSGGRRSAKARQVEADAQAAEAADAIAEVTEPPKAMQEPPPGADEPFEGPWPMFDDLLAAVIQVAERRVSSELRGEAALVAVRDFGLRLYKELLADLGDVVEEEEDEDEDED